jgi:hypothetical protein
LIFPVTRADDPAIEVTDLTVWIDSVEIKDIVYAADMRFPPYDWSYRGYRFSGEVETQRTTHVRVNYTMPLAMTRSEAFFRYVLRSGGTWSAPILKETVIVHAGRGLAVHPLSAKTLKPIVRGGTITWMLRNSRRRGHRALGACALGSVMDGLDRRLRYARLMRTDSRSGDDRLLVRGRPCRCRHRIRGDSV